MQNNSEKGSLSETFDAFGAAPKEGAWESIAAALEEPKSNRKAIIWWWSSGLAATLVIGIALFSYISGNQEKQGRQHVSALDASKKNQQSQQQSTSEKQAPALKNKTKNQQTTHRDIVSTGKEILPERKKNDNNHLPENDPSVALISNVVADKIPLENEVIDTSSTSNTEKLPADETTELAILNENDSSEDTLKNAAMVCIRISYPKWRFGINGDLAWNNSEANPLTETDPTIPNFSADAFTYPNYNPPPFMRKNAGVQLTVGRNLFKNHRFWLESGFQYNRFVSDRYTILAEDKKGYLIHEGFGVPLNVSYSLFGRNRWSLSISGGLLNQWIYKSTQKVLVKDSEMSIMADTEEKNPTIYKEHFHLLSGTVGLEFAYRFRHNWQLTLQPQFRYYLGSASKSPWTDTFQRSWFGGTVGLRYTIFH